MSLMQYVIDLMRTCPHIQVEDPTGEPPVIHAEGTDSEPDSYSVESIPGAPNTRPYLRGGGQKQYLFALNSRKATFTDPEKIQNAHLYEQVTRWMETVSRNRLKLPPMGDGLQPLRLEATDSGYPLEMAEDNNSGLYVMQCRLVYYEKAR